jgi:hypothetical protein
MKKREIDHVLRAAGRITGEKQFIIIGSQSLHGKYPDLPDDIVKSVEVDLLASKKPGRTEWLGAIGVYSPFHESFGYYADPVDDKTAILPKGWKGRLVNLSAGDTDGVKGLCLEPHDLAIAKYAASREKGLIFTRELARRGLLSEARLLALLEQTPVDEDARERIRGQIGRDFSAASDLGAADAGVRSEAQSSRSAASNALEETEAIRARGRRRWLKMRQHRSSVTSGIESAKERDLKNEGPAAEPGLDIDDDTHE